LGKQTGAPAPTKKLDSNFKYPFYFKRHAWTIVLQEMHK